MTFATRCARLALAFSSLTFATTVQAAPIDYTINFTWSEGHSQTPTGSFTYDAAAEIFTNFHVSWNGTLFDLTGSANSPTANPLCGAAVSGPALGFAIMTGSTNCPYEQLWTGGTSVSFVSFTLFATPDTGSIPGRRAPLRIADLQDRNAQPFLLSGGSFTIDPPPPPPPSTVPEPTSIALVVSGLAGIVLRRRRTS